MPDRMPDRMPENMSDRMPEDLPVTKCINVMVGITRSKVIFCKRLPGRVHQRLVVITPGIPMKLLSMTQSSYEATCTGPTLGTGTYHFLMSNGNDIHTVVKT